MNHPNKKSGFFLFLAAIAFVSPKVSGLVEPKVSGLTEPKVSGPTEPRSGNVYETQYKRAIQGVLTNIQFNGAIVASPSQSDPNYYYNWVRDTGLTMRTVVTLAYDPNSPAALRKELPLRIDRWIDWELHLQIVPKLTDLGEPRFNVDGTANNDPWNRPQNDGPAIRAQTAIMVANQWLAEGRKTEVEQRLYRPQIPADTLIKRDLEFVAHHWMDESFDLWEEEFGMHFYTLTQQKVALLKGAELANQLGDSGGANFYGDQAEAISKYLGQFYDSQSKTILYALDLGHRLPQKTTTLDIAILLAANQTYDQQFYVPVDQVTRTVPALMHEFKNEYSINHFSKLRADGTKGVALGRYPGDRYSGTDFSSASPWFLSTLAVAEYYCRIDKVKYKDTITAQFDLVLAHIGQDGSMQEQFNRDTGYGQGARDLTWSYASYITAYRACFSNP